MFCPFINGKCREDCAFRHMPRAAVGTMVNNTMTCSLAIAADELTEHIYQKALKEENQSS